MIEISYSHNIYLAAVAAVNKLPEISFEIRQVYFPFCIISLRPLL